MRLHDIAQHDFRGEFRQAVGVFRAEDRGFRNRAIKGLVSIDGGRRGEDEIADAMGDRRSDEGAGRARIVFVIFERLADRFRNADRACEMENGLDRFSSKIWSSRARSAASPR
ncbi:hypothetical protein L904_02310 [Agrobacterium sp. LY4]|nr:hypothetical protein L904_02310 [Agrobacterium sp. LY4]